MDELRGPNIQIVLHVKEGLGFGFMRSPFIVSGSLNGYMLETDSVVPTHAPIFDSELVWEADKRRFRSLRVQNVPVKVEVYTTATQGRKDKIGYLLLSLLGAQPCPSNKINDVKHTWHRLLGVKAEGKCCHPQLLMSLTVEDRVNTPTPRNELRMFHSNEIAYPPSYNPANPAGGRNILFTLEEYITESKKTVTSPELQPRLIVDEGLIQIGDGKHLFLLSFVIGAVENLDMLLPDHSNVNKEAVDCYVSYSVFTHNIMTDRVAASVSATGSSAQFNQRTSLRLRSCLATLARYFAQCPYLVTKVCVADKDVGICSMDLRKLVPTEDLQQFPSFCNSDGCLSIHERCFLLRCDAAAGDDRRRPFVDVEMSLKYGGCDKDKVQKPKVLTARSATQLESGRKNQELGPEVTLDCRGGSCTDFDQAVGNVAYTNMAVGNTARYKNAAGESMVQTNEIADLIKRMCDSFAETQERLLARPRTSDANVQCDHTQDKPCDTTKVVDEVTDETRQNIDTTSDANVQCDQTQDKPCDTTKVVDEVTDETRQNIDTEPVRLEMSKSDTCIQRNDRAKVDLVKTVLSPTERDSIMERFVNELEDWKEKQQELFKIQLRRKEEYHLSRLSQEWCTRRAEAEARLARGVEQCRALAADLSRATDDFRLRGYRNTERERKEYHLSRLSQEWSTRRAEAEARLARGVEQCRALAADLSRATDDFRLRGYRNTERERKLLEAKKALEAHYTAKYQELREASQKMEDDMNHQIKLKDMRVEELEARVHQLERQVEVLKNNIKNSEKDAESRYSGLTKDQTASLIQELRCLEEKLDGAVQSKAFFKEQWGRAVRELHLHKLQARRGLLQQLQRERQQLGDLGLDTIIDQEENPANPSVDINKLKDDFYVDILANTPALDSHSMISASINEGMFDDKTEGQKNPMNDKISSLIAQRDQLVREDSPDEAALLNLNREIRAMLLNCAT